MQIDLSHEKTILRKEPCRLCGEPEAAVVAKIDYWDLAACDMVQCVTCNHVQLDPMLSPKQMDEGCFAYYIFESLSSQRRGEVRNRLRNYRRGILFGFDLKFRGIHPKSVLEIGPGSGYFLAGLKFVFPELKATVLDVVEDVLKRNAADHGFKTVLGTPDQRQLQIPEKFDLIIARDVVEHVGELGLMIENIKNLLAEGGHFHFLVPNGQEEAWCHYAHWKVKHEKSELLINHVNYFDGRSLQKFLEKNHFRKVKYYNYDLKDFFRGKGWKLFPDWARPSKQRPYAEEIRLKDQIHENKIEKSEVIDKWYFNGKFRWLAYVVVWYHHQFLIQLNPVSNIGHETYGLFRMDGRT